MVTFSSFWSLLSSSCVLLVFFSLAIGAKNDVVCLCHVPLQLMGGQVAKAASYKSWWEQTCSSRVASLTLKSWLTSPKCCDINLFFWIQRCRLRLIPCPLALGLFVLLCWMSFICSCLLSCHSGSVATSYNKYSSATWTLPFALILCSYLTAR